VQKRDGAEEDDCKTQGQYVLVMSLQNKLK